MCPPNASASKVAKPPNKRCLAHHQPQQQPTPTREQHRTLAQHYNRPQAKLHIHEAPRVCRVLRGTSSAAAASPSPTYRPIAILTKRSQGTMGVYIVLLFSAMRHSKIKIFWESSCK